MGVCYMYHCHICLSKSHNTPIASELSHDVQNWVFAKVANVYTPQDRIVQAYIGKPAHPHENTNVPILSQWLTR